MEDFDFKLYAQMDKQLSDFSNEVHKRIGTQATMVLLTPKATHLEAKWLCSWGQDVVVRVEYDAEDLMQALADGYEEQATLIREAYRDRY